MKTGFLYALIIFAIWIAGIITVGHSMVAIIPMGIGVVALLYLGESKEDVVDYSDEHDNSDASLG